MVYQISQADNSSFFRGSQHCGGIISIDAQTNSIQKALALHTRMISGGHLQPYEGGEFLYGFLCGLLRHVLHPAAFHTESTASQAALLMEKEFATIRCEKSGIDAQKKYEDVLPPHQYRQWSQIPFPLKELQKNWTNPNFVSIIGHRRFVQFFCSDIHMESFLYSGERL